MASNRYPQDVEASSAFVVPSHFPVSDIENSKTPGFCDTESGVLRLQPKS